MASPLPEPGPVLRFLIPLIYKSKYHKLTAWSWRRQPGPPHIFRFHIKARADDFLGEAHAMQFVAANTSIPVPKLYYAFVHKGKSFIVMRHIKGRMAGSEWMLRTEESKQRVLDQLRGFVNELRSIPPPEGAKVGSINGGPLYDPRLPTKLYWGPFATVRDFHQELVNDIDFDEEIALPDVTELFEFYKRSGNELVLTHGDLSSFNIMVQGDEVVGIIDWETAGWYPPYWEYTCAKYVNPQNPFWAEPVDRFVTPLPYEWKMETIRRRYFGDF